MDVQQTADRVRAALSGRTRVLGFRDGVREDEPDAGESDEIAVLVADGSPGEGFTSYSTLDVARFPTNVEDDRGWRIATELITVGRTDERAFADVLAKCAFAVSGGSLHVTPLAIIPDAVEAADEGHTMRHVLLVPPFIWPDLEIVVEEEAAGDTPAQVTTWLQAVPISDAEFHHAAAEGAQALFDRLESAGADVSSLDRASVV